MEIQGTLGTAAGIAVVVFIAHKLISDEKIRQQLWSFGVFFFFVMVFINHKSAISVTVDESKEWWPVIVEVFHQVNENVRGILHILFQGGRE